MAVTDSRHNLIINRYQPATAVIFPRRGLYQGTTEPAAENFIAIGLKGRTLRCAIKAASG
jgi:hypothetical protein